MKKETAPTEIPAPLVIRQLIELHNIRLQEYQQASLRDIQAASLELMTMLGLLPEQGWRLDIDNLKYIKVDTTNDIAPIK